MLNKLKIMAKMLRPPKNTAPEFLDSDVFLVSYPKSGNTWLRFLLANYISGGPVDMLQAESIMPDMHYNPQDIVESSGPRIIKSHDPYTPTYKRVVYIVRDGRDVAVSYYFHLKKFKVLPVDTTFSEYLDSFIGGKFFPSVPWGTHVDDWLDGAKDLLVIRYEDMLADTAQVLEKVIRFCKLDYNQENADNSVTACSLSNLRQIENNQFHVEKRFSTSDPAIHFFRKGIAGDWRNHFDESDVEKFMKAFSKTMNRVGYGE